MKMTTDGAKMRKKSEDANKDDQQMMQAKK